ncbi:hypothetical protein D3C71_2144170 [compost metagenome]
MQHAGHFLQPPGGLETQRMGIGMMPEGVQRVILLPGIRCAQGNEGLLNLEAAAG